MRGRLRTILPAVVVLALVAATGVLAPGCASKTSGAQQMATLGQVTKGRLAVAVSATGQVVPAQAQEVRANTSGTVASVLADEGDRVEAGQVLAELENADLLTQTTLARLDVADVESEIAELQSQGQLSGSVIRKEVRADAPARVVSLAPGVAKLAQAKSGAALMTLAAQDSIELVVEVTYPERQQIKVGCPATVWPKEYTGSVDGHVTWISNSPVTSPEAYAYQVGVAVDQPGLLREGGKASAHVQGPSATVVRDGVFRWANSRVVTAPFDGTVSQLEVQAGEMVAAGQLLAVVESDQGPKQLESLQRDLERKKLALAQREAGVAGLKVTAPASGVLSGFSLEKGQAVQAGGSLGRVLAEGLPQVEADVDETEVAQIHEDLSAEVTLEALPGRTFKGKVTRVAVEGVSQGGTASYPTRVTLDEPVPGVRPGMTAQVSILVAERAGALIVPVEALVEEGGRVAVRVPASAGKEQSFRLQAVEVGLRSDTQAEVLSGLAEGDTIVVALYSSGEDNSFMRPGGMMFQGIRREGGTRPNTGGSQGGTSGGGGQ